MPVLKVENVTSADRKRVRDVSFEVHHGEVLGFAGLVGSGRTDLMNCLFGAEPRATGKIILNGADITPKNPVEAVKSGMAYLTENRRQTGFTPNFTIEGNIAVTKSVKDAPLRGTWGLVNRKAERTVAEGQRRQLSIRCAGIDQSILELSGGNQQKVLVGKWMSIAPSVIIFDEPTRGIDVGAKSQIHEIIRTPRQRRQGGHHGVVRTPRNPGRLRPRRRVPQWPHHGGPRRCHGNRGIHSERRNEGRQMSQRVKLGKLWDIYGTLCILLVIVVLFSALSPQYFTRPENIVQIFLQSSITILIALGEFFPILIAGIDLSVGAVLALTGMITAQLMVAGFDPTLAVLLGGVGGAWCSVRSTVSWSTSPACTPSSSRSAPMPSSAA